MTQSHRNEPYSHAELRPLLAPQSIAIVGASPRAGSFGGRTLANLGGYSGRVYPINAKYAEIGDQACFPSLDALPEAPDLVVITPPGETVEGVIEECIARGVPSVMVYASGFAETAKPDDVARQERLAHRAREAGLRLLGPNCVGLLNYLSGARVTFAGVPEGRLEAGPAIGLVCQSGALGFALAQAMERGVAFSHVLSCGNSTDVDAADWVSALAEDPSCTAIACAFEGVSDPMRFLKAAEKAWARDKPLIVFKMATGEEGAAAAMSHTGSLAGSKALWNALFDRGGAVVVEDFEALIESAWFFAKAPAPKARGAAVLSGSGGAAIMGADSAEATGVPLPQPTGAGLATLQKRLPPFVPARNPCDVTAQVINDMDTLLACADALLGEPEVGALLFGYAYAYETATERQPHLSALAAKHGKPLCYVWLTQLLEGPGAVEAERDPNIAVFRSMRRCFETLKAWNDRAARRDAEKTALPAKPVNRPEAVERILSEARDSTLGERAVKQILSKYGIAGPREILVGDAKAAAAAAQEIGGCLALKIDSPDIPHKTEAGGVMLGVEGPEAAVSAFAAMISAVRAARPEARIDGVLIQEMIPPGVEIIAGFRSIEGFGPSLTIGMGGVLAELLRDTRTVLAPITEDDAKALLRSLRGAALFDGFRGAPSIDMAALARSIAALSRLAVNFGAEIEELDVNPLICLPDRVIAVDGLAALTPR